MKQKIIIGNWKNYLGHKESISLANSLLDLVTTDKTRVMVSPNHLYLKEVNQILSTTDIEVISQNLTSAESKSDTGGITAVNLKEISINRSLVAHSETRIREKTPQSILLEIIIRFSKVMQRRTKQNKKSGSGLERPSVRRSL